jgi:hypothetical protein
VGPVLDPLFLRKSGSAGNRTRTSGSLAMNSGHYTTEAVYFLLHNIHIYIYPVRTLQEAHLRSAARNSDH